MAKNVLKDVKQAPTIKQRLMGGIVAARLLKSEGTPLTPDAVGNYYGALAGKKPDTSHRSPENMQARIAQALLWADIKTRQFHSLCADWYLLAAEVFPDDERCVFYVAALYQHGLIQASATAQEKMLGVLMKSIWRESAYWIRLSLPRNELLKALADTLNDEEIRITPERLPILEAAFDSSTLTEAQRITTARWLGVAYRASGRSDDRAEIIYRYLFVHVSEDKENNEYLASLFAGRELDDANACAVYARMVQEADKVNDHDAKARWSVRLSRAFIAQNRLGAEAIQPLQAALTITPNDRLLEAALAYSVGRSELVMLEPSLMKHLEVAIAFESEFVPHFTERQWQWSVVPRALALTWGKLGRKDSLASFIYARATELCPEEKVLWSYYAAALSDAKDYSRKAITVYERAQQFKQADEDILLALATAYQENRTQDGNERRKSLVLWEDLYRKGKATYEITNALIEVYLHEEQLSDTALELLQKMADTAGKIPSPLVMRVAQEWARRGDYPAALRWYQEAERAMPDHFQTIFEYGILLKEQFHEYAGAVNVLARAVVLPAGTRHLEAHVALAEGLIALEKRDDARRVFQIILERIDSNHTPTLLHLARLNLKYEEQGMLRAETLFERAVSVAPDSPEAYEQLVELYRAQGNTKMEQWALEQSLKLGAPSAVRYRELANLYIRRGEFTKAESALRQIVALGKAERDVYTLLGDVIQQARRAS